MLKPGTANQPINQSITITQTPILFTFARIMQPFQIDIFFRKCKTFTRLPSSSGSPAPLAGSPCQSWRLWRARGRAIPPKTISRHTCHTVIEGTYRLRGILLAQLRLGIILPVVVMAGVVLALLRVESVGDGASVLCVSLVSLL